MIFFVTGASGSGKTACMPELARRLPEVALHDFDELGVPPGATKVWRQESTEAWLRRGIEYAREGRDLVVCGQAVLGEVLACPSAPEAGAVAVCLLDCDDVLRIDRLRARGTHGATQDTLSWAAWLRVHSVDPAWRPDTIQDGGAAGMSWERWAGLARGDARWQVAVVDTTALGLAEVAAEVARWVRAGQQGARFEPAARSPLLEHDPARRAFIEPTRTVRRRKDMPELAVGCFFAEVIRGLADSGRARELTALRSELAPVPIYELTHEGQRLAIFHAGLGAPLSGGILEEVFALGAERVVVCGGAGALDRDLVLGHVMVPTEAVRDEGTSHHYLPPSRTVAAHPDAVAAIEATLERRGVPYRRAITWTTDAFFRETRAKIARRRAEGCATVEMEAAALFAIGQFRAKKVGVLLYAGDDLSGADWDHRAWNEHASGREQLFWLAVEAAASMA
jgi:uridine phosphorylase